MTRSSAGPVRWNRRASPAGRWVRAASGDTRHHVVSLCWAARRRRLTVSPPWLFSSSTCLLEETNLFLRWWRQSVLCFRPAFFSPMRAILSSWAVKQWWDILTILDCSYHMKSIFNQRERRRHCVRGRWETNETHSWGSEVGVAVENMNSAWKQHRVPALRRAGKSFGSGWYRACRLDCLCLTLLHVSYFLDCCCCCCCCGKQEHYPSTLTRVPGVHV